MDNFQNYFHEIIPELKNSIDFKDIHNTNNLSYNSDFIINICCAPNNNTWFLPLYKLCYNFKEVIKYKCSSISINQKDNIEIEVKYGKINIEYQDKTAIELMDITVTNTNNLLIGKLSLFMIENNFFFEALKFCLFNKNLNFDLLEANIILNDQTKTSFLFKINQKKQENNTIYHLKIIYTGFDVELKKEENILLTQKCIQLSYNESTKTIMSMNNIIIFIYPKIIEILKPYLSQFSLIIKIIQKNRFSLCTFNFPIVEIKFIQCTNNNENYNNPPLISVFLHNLIYNHSSFSLNTKISAEFTNPFNQNVSPITKNLEFNYQFSDVGLLNINNTNLTVSPMLVNLFTSIANGNYDFYSTLTNCTGNVFIVSFIHYSNFLYPNSTLNLLSDIIKISFDINDKVYECSINIGNIFKKLFDKELFQTQNIPANNDDIIEFETINLIYNEEDKKKINLLFVLRKDNKIKIDLFLYDNLVIFPKFPINSNYLSLMTNKTSKLTSVDISEYHTTKNISQLNSNISIAYEFPNSLICNYLSDILSINITHNENNLTYTINSKSELNIEIEYSNETVVIFEFTYENITYKSSNAIKFLESGKGSLEEITFTPNNKTKVPLIVNISFSKFFDNENSHYRVVRVFPSIVIRNLTSIVCDNPNNKNLLFFIYNDDCDKIQETSLQVNGNEQSSEKFRSNKKNISLARESSFIFSESTIKKMKLCYEANSKVYLSDSFDLNITETKDYIIPILKSNDKEKEIHSYFLFRMKIRKVNIKVLLITISSFINFIPKTILQKISIITEHPYEMSYFFDQDESGQKGINVDTLYLSNQKLLPFYDFTDAFTIYNLSCNLINKFEVIFNEKFKSSFTIKNIISMQDFQLTAYNINKVSDDELNSIIIHKRMMHSPYNICEFYRELNNNANNTYIFVSNETNSQQEVYYNSEKSIDMNEIKVEPGKYELCQLSKVYSLVITMNKREVDLIKKGVIYYAKNEKEFEGIYFEKNLNIIKLKLYNVEDKKQENEYDDAVYRGINAKCNGINITFNLLPFFVPNEDKYSFKIFSDYLMIIYSFSNSYTVNDILNLCVFKLFFQKYTGDDKYINIISSQYLMNIRIEYEKLVTNFYTLINQVYAQKIYAKKIRINIPVVTDIDIDENLIQIFHFLLFQINAEQKKQPLINFENISLMKSVILLENSPIQIIKEIQIFNFIFNMNIEYKKGINFTIKNSQIKSSKQEIKDVIGKNGEIYSQLKNKFMRTFFSNIYSFFSSTEIFGNFGDFVNSIKLGYKRLTESSYLPVGIIGFVSESVGGGISSILGIGKSILKSLHTKNKFDYEIFNIFKEESSHFHSENEKFDKKSIFYQGGIVNCKINCDYINYTFEYGCEIKINNKKRFLLAEKYFICICNDKGDCNLILPYFHMIKLNKNENEKAILITMKNSKKFEFKFHKGYDIDYIYNFVSSKFIQ